MQESPLDTTPQKLFDVEVEADYYEISDWRW